MSWLSLAWHWYSAEAVSPTGVITHPHADLVNPIGTFVGAAGAFITAAIVAYAAVRNARTATRQANIASQRHEAHTDADRQRRITESFSKAVEQLGSEKVEVRLGGIYALERISQESPESYWTVMETLAAFVRERTRSSGERGEQRRPGPPTDVVATLTVISRRGEADREREKRMWWRFDLAYANLAAANLNGIHFEGANFQGAYLGGAKLLGAYLESARLSYADLRKANLSDAYLEYASFRGAHLEDAVLVAAHLKGTDFSDAHLEGANLSGAHLERAFLLDAKGLDEAEVAKANGDAQTQLPEEMGRPAHWPPAEPGPDFEGFQAVRSTRQ